MGRRLLVLILTACTSGGPSDGDRDPDAGTDTDTDIDTDTAAAPAIEAQCTLQVDNALRADCVVTVTPPGPIEIAFAPTAGGPPRTTSVTDPAAEHDVTLWRMHAETEYRWTAVATSTGLTATGTFTTGPLAAGADVELQIEVLAAGPTASDDLMFLIACGGPFAVVVDAAGEVVWYQDLVAGLPPGPRSAEGLVFTTSGDVAAVVDRSRVRRFGLDGRLILDLERGSTPGFDSVIHHDLFERDGLLYVIHADAYDVGGETYVMDGVYVFDAAGDLVADWLLGDHVTPSGPPAPSPYWNDEFPDGIDYAHTNGIFVDEAHDLYLSSYLLDTVLKVRGDPLDPAFGEILWVLDGAGTSPWPSDFVITDPLGLSSDRTFSHQHHPNVLPNGNLLLFDNGSGAQPSRSIELALDEALGTAELRGSWSVAQVCPIGGSTFELSNGNVLSTCSTAATSFEFDRVAGTPLRAITPFCDVVRQLPRGIPVRL